MIDLFEQWFKERFPQFHSEVVTGNCTGGKVIMLHKKNPNLTLHVNGDDWIFSLSINGHCWNNADLDLKKEIKFGDPKFFEIMEWRIKRRVHGGER